MAQRFRIIQEKSCNFKSHNDLHNSFKIFLNDRKASLYLLEIDFLKEFKSIAYFVNYLDTQQAEFKENNETKNVIILIRMKRNDIHRPALNLFTGWDYLMFENLKAENYNIADLFSIKPLKEVIKNELLVKFEDSCGFILKTSLEIIGNKSQNLKHSDFLNIKHKILKIIEN